jgi:hypothetical protein
LSTSHATHLSWTFAEMAPYATAPEHSAPLMSQGSCSMQDPVPAVASLEREGPMRVVPCVPPRRRSSRTIGIGWGELLTISSTMTMRSS